MFLAKLFSYLDIYKLYIINIIWITSGKFPHTKNKFHTSSKVLKIRMAKQKAGEQIGRPDRSEGMEMERA